MKILVVDDEIDQLESLKRGLRSRGHSVLVALSAQQALDYLAETGAAIDLVVTDYAMPVMSGLDLLKKIRAGFGNIPVIMMTAYGRKDLVIETLHHGCNGFIEKPFSLESLVMEIGNATRYLPRPRDDFSRVAPVLAHQLNNPLAAISGSAQVAMLSLDRPEKLRECMGRAFAGAEQIREISKGILRAAKREDEKAEELDVAEVVRECLQMFEELVALKGISLETHLNSARMEGYRFDLEQIFNNLILNAIDAMEGKERDLFLRASVLPVEDAVSVVIEDSGCGIPAASIGAIFDPYYTSRKKGTGLGLAIVKKAVEKHKGDIRVSSVPGRGARFTVSFPGGASRLSPPPGDNVKGGKHVTQ